MFIYYLRHDQNSISSPYFLSNHVLFCYSAQQFVDSARTLEIVRSVVIPPFREVHWEYIRQGINICNQLSQVATEKSDTCPVQARLSEFLESPAKLLRDSSLLQAIPKRIYLLIWDRRELLISTEPEYYPGHLKEQAARAQETTHSLNRGLRRRVSRVKVFAKLLRWVQKMRRPYWRLVQTRQHI